MLYQTFGSPIDIFGNHNNLSHHDPKISRPAARPALEALLRGVRTCRRVERNSSTLLSAGGRPIFSGLDSLHVPFPIRLIRVISYSQGAPPGHGWKKAPGCVIHGGEPQGGRLLVFQATRGCEHSRQQEFAPVISELSGPIAPAYYYFYSRVYAPWPDVWIFHHGNSCRLFKHVRTLGRGALLRCVGAFALGSRRSRSSSSSGGRRAGKTRGVGCEVRQVQHEVPVRVARVHVRAGRAVLVARMRHARGVGEGEAVMEAARVIRAVR